MATKFVARGTDVTDTSSIADLLGAATILELDQPCRFDLIRLPDINLPDGRLVGFDPFEGSATAYTRRLRPGSHAVHLAIARLDIIGRRVVFALIGDVAARVDRYELARTGSKNDDRGLGVDVGVAALASPAGYQLIKSTPREKLTKALESGTTRKWCTVASSTSTGAMFECGLGDGSYPAFFGISELGDPALLLVDFACIDWSRRPIPFRDDGPERSAMIRMVDATVRARSRPTRF